MGGILSISNGRRFVELLTSQPYVYAPGVFDAHSAGLAAKAGHRVVYMSGYSVANSLGYPDVGMTNQAENVRVADNIVRLLESGIDGIHNVPVIADADDGYGGVGNVERTIRDYARTGVAGIHIEDQVFPKRCGHIAGKQVLELEEAVGKVRIAVDTRNKLDTWFYLIARTDAAGAVGGSLDEAIRRGRAYADAGVDAVWAELGNTERELLAAFARAMRETHPEVVLAVNYSSNLRWSDTKITHQELAEMGYRFIFTTLASLEAARMAMYDHLVRLKEDGERAQWQLEAEKDGHPLGSSQTALGLLPHHLINRERKYVPGAVARQDGSEGFGSAKDEHAQQVHGRLEK